MIRMLIVGYSFGIRSERRLCNEVHLNLGYRWFCRLSLDAVIPDHSTFSKARHGRFRDADLLRQVFETVVRRCMDEGLVGGEGFAVDASIIIANAHRQRGIDNIDEIKPEASRAVAEYWAVLDAAVRRSAAIRTRPPADRTRSSRPIPPHSGRAGSPGCSRRRHRPTPAR
jgi:IS5 family transposase